MQMKRKGAWRTILPGGERLVVIRRRRRTGNPRATSRLAAGSFEGPKNFDLDARRDSRRQSESEGARKPALY